MYKNNACCIYKYIYYTYNANVQAQKSLFSNENPDERIFQQKFKIYSFDDKINTHTHIMQSITRSNELKRQMRE